MQPKDLAVVIINAAIAATIVVLIALGRVSLEAGVAVFAALQMPTAAPVLARLLGKRDEEPVPPTMRNPPGGES